MKEIKKEFKCDKMSCKKIIGYISPLNGRRRYYEGTHQCGRYSCCSEKCLNYLLKTQ